jgi:hypothetical protein
LQQDTNFTFNQLLPSTFSTRLCLLYLQPYLTLISIIIMDTLFHLAARAVDRNGIDPDNIDVNSTDPMVIGMSRRYCTVGKCPESWQTIDYRPSIPGNVIYMLCFFALFGAQLWYGIRGKTWTFMGTMCAGLLGEIVGYIGRIMLNLNPFIMNNFLM